MDYKLPTRIENSNKATYGRVLNIAGSDYMPGAAYLSSVSALKVGCGYCFLASSEKCIHAVAAQTQNVVFVPYKDLTKHINSADVISIGCGLTLDNKAVNLFKTLLKYIDIKTPLVIDADGLNILAKHPMSLTNLKTILTPHPKEASRLLNCSLEDVLSDVEAAALKIAVSYNSIVVLKTHRTLVVAPSGKKYINATGNSSMAKAGSGDVLTGIISGLIAQGMDMFEAACLGVYLHGLTGDLAKNELTEYSVMAEDLISFIPNAIKLIISE